MNGQTISWNEASPANTDLVGQGDDDIRSTKSAIRTAMGDEHYFPASGGASAGYHLLGSARPFQAAASQISSTGTIGRLMVNSTDYSLWGDTGTNPVPLGHQNLIVNTNAAGTFQRSGTTGLRTTNATQYGFIRHDGSSAASTIAYAGSGFSGLPALFLFAEGANSATPIVARVVGSPTRTLVDVTARFATTGGVVGSVTTINWMSVGTVASGVA